MVDAKNEEDFLTDATRPVPQLERLLSKNPLFPEGGSVTNNKRAAGALCLMKGYCIVGKK